MKNKIILFVTFFLIILLTACMEARSLCTSGEIQYRERTSPFPALAGQNLNPQQVEIKGKMMDFDQVITGQLCNNHLEGTVYVGCDIEIYSWETTSNFLDGCDYYVEPGTIIYVASHNNSAYYKGCSSCHMSGEK